MTRNATATTSAALSLIRMGIVAGAIAALLLASQSVALAGERDERPDEPTRQEEPRDTSMNDDPADNGNSMDDDPADNGNSMNEDPADNGNSINEEPGEDEEKPGTITAPVEFDMTSRQSRPAGQKTGVSELQNAEPIMSQAKK